MTTFCMNLADSHRFFCDGKPCNLFDHDMHPSVALEQKTWTKHCQCETTAKDKVVHVLMPRARTNGETRSLPNGLVQHQQSKWKRSLSCPKGKWRNSEATRRGKDHDGSNLGMPRKHPNCPNWVMEWTVGHNRARVFTNCSLGPCAQRHADQKKSHAKASVMCPTTALCVLSNLAATRETRQSVAFLHSLTFLCGSLISSGMNEFWKNGEMGEGERKPER